MASPRQKKDERPQPRLYLVAPAAADIASLKAQIGSALAAADIAALLLRLPDDDDRALINRVKALAPAIQDAGAALILDGHPDLVARAGADGAHLTGFAAFEEALPRLKPDRIAGAGNLQTRHDAMLAAEKGADYVMFGEPAADGERPGFDAILDRVSWWAEVFEAPCVGFAATLDEIGPLVAAGADFVATPDSVFADPRGIEAALADAAARLRLPETAS